MAIPSPTERQLQSWKEIAAHLNVSVRTAQTWERERGLPVRRLPGPRGRVTVSIQDLELWLAPASEAQAAPAAAAPAEFERAFTPHSRHWFWASATVALVVLLAVGAISARVGWPDLRVPAAYRFEANRLIVSDADGRELWRKAYSYPILSNQAKVWFGDLDGDGQVTTLVSAVNANLWHEAGPLLCYSQAGKERWRFSTSRTVVSGSGERFAPPYVVAGLAVLGSGKNRRIAVISQHDREYAAQTAILSAEGKILREYWHSGGIPAMAVTRLGGREALLLGAIANGYHAADLVVLDPDTLAGASREDNPDYQLQNLGAPVERARILFRQSCVNKATESYNGVTRLEVRGGVIMADLTEHWIPGAAPVISYGFNDRLELESVSAFDTFVLTHLALQSAGVLHHAYNNEELAPLKNIRYLTPLH